MYNTVSCELSATVNNCLFYFVTKKGEVTPSGVIKVPLDLGLLSQDNSYVTIVIHKTGAIPNMKALLKLGRLLSLPWQLKGFLKGLMLMGIQCIGP